MARTKASFWTKSLDKLMGTFVHAEPTAPAPKKKEKAGKAVRTAAAPAKSSAPDADATAADVTAAVKPADDKTPKKKVPVQPWYRHRQRW